MRNNLLRTTLYLLGLLLVGGGALLRISHTIARGPWELLLVAGLTLTLFARLLRRQPVQPPV